ncbi:hypothetical protein HPB49_021514 [Dermacentor silvarum]|uniref:Uncharacterized protein n=1 Tax=Dermacentor silvarum TaxID=543639 RepID=A0ACB8CN44_DERSI|nr:hypothetical protein HPB49_021514 [Dermacentor silvarum]
MSRKTLARPPEQGQPSTSSLMFRQRDFGSSDQLHSRESSTPEAMDSDNEYTVVMGRRLKKRMRQMSSEQTSSNEREQQSFMVSYVPLTASHNLNSLSRQFLYEYFESVAPGQINEIRINSRKNILTVDAKSSTIIEKLKTIPTLSGIPVRSFFTYGKESTTGVISDVDLDMKNVDLRNLLSSSVQILEIHRLGNSRCIKLGYSRWPRRWVAISPWATTTSSADATAEIWIFGSELRSMVSDFSVLMGFEGGLGADVLIHGVCSSDFEPSFGAPPKCLGALKSTAVAVGGLLAIHDALVSVTMTPADVRRLDPRVCEDPP